MKFILSLAFLSLAWAQVPPPNPEVTATDQLGFESSFVVDSETCEYSLTFSFQHNPDFPVPSGPSDCNPFAEDLAIASDGLPFLASRESYELLSEDIREATPFNHISLDFQPCGHPPLDVFNKPHYDVHVYTSTIEERILRTCELIPGTPECNPEAEGNAAFYGAIPDDVTTHQVYNNTGIIYSGTHSWNVAEQPSSVEEWTQPVFITGGYGGAFAFWEPMIPLDMVTGSEDHSYEETVAFPETMEESMPRHYTLEYEAATGITTVTLTQAKARGCSFESPIEPTTDSDPTTGSSKATIVHHHGGVILATALSIVALSSFLA